MLPWHWLLITQDGYVRPCSHGSLPVGNLAEASLTKIWNGQKMQELRASILEGKIHPVCHSRECPYQRPQVAFRDPTKPIFPKGKLAVDFDERFYLERYPDVARAVRSGALVSGFEHFLRHGCYESRKHRYKPRTLGAVFAPIKALVLKCCGRPDLLMPGRTRRVRNAIHAIHEFDRGATVVRSDPVDLVLSLTTVCNMRCVMCPQGRGLVANPQHMPLSMVNGIRPFVKKASRICLSGVGEQTVGKAFKEILRIAPHGPDRCLKMNSNGYSLTDKKIDELVKSSLTEFNVSLDAATPVTYGKIRGGDFRKVIGGITRLVEAKRRLLKNDLLICINMTLSRVNLSEAVDFVMLGKTLGVDLVVFSQLYSFGDNADWRVSRGDWMFEYSEQMIGRNFEEARTVLRKVKETAAQIGMLVEYRSNVEQYL